MALTICTSSILRSSSAHRRSSSTVFSFSNSVIFCSKTPKSCLSTSVPGLGISSFQPWIGLRHMGISIRQNYVQKEGEGRCRRGKVVYASLFGVGAPEALVIGVVALLVFGPKGLAEVARNLGKTLRAFQPTIRELQEVSREFKNTLEREIGLDEVPPSMQSSTRSTSATSSQPTSDLNGAPSTSKPYSTEEYLKTTEEQLAYAAQKQAPSQEGQSQGETSQQEGAPPEAGQPLNIGEFLVQTQLRSSASSQPEETLLQEEQSETQPQPQATAPETNTKIPPPEKTESEA